MPKPLAPATLPPSARRQEYRKQRYLHGPAWVDATGTRRRLQALAAVGWSPARVSAELGFSRTWAQKLTTVGRVHRVNAALVADVYERLWNAAPPQGTAGERLSMLRALSAARKAGWPPPLAWDDNSIDDPAAGPAVVVRRPRRRAPGEVAAEVEHLRGFGLTDEVIAARLGVKLASLHTALRRAA